MRCVLLTALAACGYSLRYTLAAEALPPGGAPFAEDVLDQPVVGAERGLAGDGWKRGKLCDVSKPPYSAKNGTKSTEQLQQAIDDCGDLAEGGTVLLPKDMLLETGSLWLRSNLTLRVEEGATLRCSDSPEDLPVVYTRRSSVMQDAHAGLLNGGRCLKKKSPLVGWDDCATWSKLSNVVIEGGGTLDGNGQVWLDHITKENSDKRPMMLDLLWIDGLTLRDMKVRRPGFWTIHPTFSNNVRIEGNDIYTRGRNTDGVDPDSCWNVYIGHNTIDTGDDCIAIKAGKDWSGRMVNISSRNILAERNYFKQGHGVSIGSETSGWVRDIVIRDSVLRGTDVAVRIKSMRGRGGGVENVLYQNLTGFSNQAIQLTLHYGDVPPTNASATPSFSNIIIRDVRLEADNAQKFILCEGLEDSVITGVALEHSEILTPKYSTMSCSHCVGTATPDTLPTPCFAQPQDLDLVF
eukprot:TRINITY_DN39134_c0_g1_i1.p1 TRINITY_DN39134_c0_g1~~TRINITY_DN39134_c0_g1_i1.p1  ORF type:complete len:464 (-),score=38.57 TRINITY_DN39134_c0_g1_i1:50-1441(-)